MEWNSSKMGRVSRAIRRALLQACLLAAPVAASGSELHRLPGWHEDHHADAWPALLAQCDVMKRRDDAWRDICEAAGVVGKPSDSQAREFFETWFEPRLVDGPGEPAQGLITGYFDPIVEGSLSPTSVHQFPLYGTPRDARLRQLSRGEIDGPLRPLAGHEILWLADPVKRHVVHVQGSSLVRLPSGGVVGVDYAGQNGKAFRPIGKEVARLASVAPGNLTLETIKDYLAEARNGHALAVLATDPSYVFFELRPGAAPAAVGALGVRLTAGRSIAVDRRHVPLGLPAWLVTTDPADPGNPLRRLVLCQDVGGAIRGQQRVDLYFGSGREAECQAGSMKQRGSLFVLVPRSGSS